MKYPVLFKRGTTEFKGNGKGVLTDAFNIKVKEVINDIFTLDFNYPITSKLGSEIMNGDIIRVDASNVLRNQKFRVMSITQNDDLTISVHCLHKTFDTATDYVRGPINLTNASCEYALNMLFNKSMKSKNYVGVSDIQNAQNFTCEGKQLADAIVGSTGSIIDTYGLGPQIERDNSEVDKIKVLKRRGKDTNILVSYGKNITGYKCVMDEQSLATVLIPVATDNNTQAKIIGSALYAPNYNDFDGELYIVEVDLTERFTDKEQITQSALAKKAEAYLRESKCNIPKFTYTIDFEKLDTSTLPDDYNLEKLYDVNIGDTLIVRHKYFRVDTQAKVNSIEYDPIAQKYTKIVFGDVRASFGEDFNSGVIVGPPGQDGKPGIDGKPGLPGADGKTYYTWIRYADDEHGRGMSDLPNGKKFIGLAFNKEVAVESNNPKDYTWSKFIGDQGIPGAPGADGKTYYTWIKYADDEHGTGISDNSVGKEYLGLAYNKEVQQESNNPSDYMWSKIKGDQGIPGAPGTDGKTYYTWIKYADTPTSGMSDDPTGKTYLGIAYNKEVPQESTRYEDYTWCKIKGDDGNIGDFPDTLPDVPKLTAETVGITGIDISWTFENKMYYTYELYGSQVPNFNPTVFDKIFEGKASSYLHQAQPNENWYFRVRAVNSYGHVTAFSNQVKVTTNKQDNFDKYFSSLAVDNLVADIFSVNHMQAGTIKGQWIDARNFTLTDGNGKRTVDFDSFGHAHLDVTTLKIQSKEVGTKEDINSAINLAEDNMLANSNFLKYNGKINGWSAWSNNEHTNIMLTNYIFSNGEGVGLYNPTKLNSVLEFHSDYMKVGGFTRLAISFDVFRESSVANAKVILRQVDDQFNIIIDSEFNIPELYDGRLSKVFEVTDNKVKWVRFILHHGGTWQNTSEASAIYFNRVMITNGDYSVPWKASSLDQLTNRYSKIESDMNQINLEVGAKVNATDVISAINLSPENIKIQSNNIDLAGATTIGSAHDGRYVRVEDETFRVMNGDTPCMHLGYRTWQGYTGVPEFLMGYNGFVYSEQQGAPYSGTYFGMSTFGNEKNPEGTKPYHSIYYRSRTRADETQINFYEDGRTKVKSMGEFSLIADGGTWLQANNGGLVFNNGFQSYSDGRIDGNMVLNKNILMNGQIYTKDLKQGFGIEKYDGVDAFMLRKMTINPMDLGHDTAESRFRNIYAENGVINTSDERLKTNLVPITHKTVRRKRSLMSNEHLNTNDFYEFIKNLQFYRYDYKSGNGDASSHNVGFVANEVSDTKVGKEFIFTDKDNFYQYNLQGYVGVIGVALQEAINKNELQSKRIDELEKLVNALADEIKTLKGGV